MDCVNGHQTSQQTNGPLPTPDPYYIPGYTGYLPQEKFRSGHTYGFTSHQILLDSSVSMSHQSVLNNVHPEDCSNGYSRPGVELDPVLCAEVGMEKSGVNGQERRHYQPNMIAGYKTFVPHYQTVQGHAYSPALGHDLAKVQQEQWWDPLVTNSIQALDNSRLFLYKHKPWATNETIVPEKQDLHKFTAAALTTPVIGFGQPGR